MNTVLQTFVDWVMYLVIFLLFGGLGAGTAALLFEAVIGTQFSTVLYAVIFGASGLMAYQVARDRFMSR